MRAVHIALLILRRGAKEGAAFWLLLLPLLIVYVLGLTLHGLFATDFVPHRPYRVALAPASGGPGETVAAALAARPDFIEVVPYDDPASARESVAARRADAAVLAQGVAGQETGIVIVAAPDSIVAHVLDGIVRAALREVPEAPEEAGPPGSGSERRGEPGAGPEEIAASPPPEASPPWAGIGSFPYFSFAIAAMFSMFTAHSAMMYLASDRASGAYARVRAAGVGRRAYFAAGYLSSVAAGFLFFAVIAAATRALFGVRWGAFSGWLVIALAGAACAGALSFALMTLSPKDPKRLEEVGSAVYTVLAFLGGSTVPLAVMPPWFAAAFSWLPNRALLDGFLRLSEGAGVQGIGRELATLAAGTCLLLAAGWAMAEFRARGEM